jgi:raffinose/stachyose/melibiose transport system permease protein
MIKKQKSLRLANMHIGPVIVLCIACILILIPLYYIVNNAFKIDLYINIDPMGFKPEYFTIDNIRNAWRTLDFPVGLQNSAILVLLSCAIMIVCGSLAGFAIAIVNNKFFKSIYIVFIFLLSVPFQVVMIPLVQELSFAGLMDSMFGTSLVFAALSLPFTIFLYTGFMRSLPRELCQAAIVDGCGMGQTYLYIYMPLMKAVTGTVLILRGTSVWNDLLVPLITFTTGKNDPLIRRLYAYCSLQFNRWDLLFAGTLLCSIPILILFLALQKVFVKGITMGAVKG